MRSRAVTMGRIADAELARGRLEVARTLLEREVLPVHEQLQDPVGVAFVSWKLGQILVREQKPLEALPRVQSAFELFAKLGHAQGIVAVGQDYVRLLQQTGATERIPAVLAILVPVARRRGLL